MRLVVLLISVVLLSSCSKRIVDLQEATHKTRIDKSLDSSSLVQVNTKLAAYRFTYEDSEYEYFIDITPGDEPIEFSLAKGFAGKAKDIKIKGKVKQGKIDHNFTAAEKDSLAAAALNKDENAVTEDSSKSKATNRTGSGAVSLIIFIVAAFAGIWLFLHFKSR